MSDCCEGFDIKAKHHSQATQLDHIPNIGKAIAEDLRGIGIVRPDQLKGKDGIKLYDNARRPVFVMIHV